jgi:hypothetical protein
MAKFDLSKYEPVAERILRFRAEHPNGAIHVRIVPEVSNFDQVVCEASVWFDLNDPRPIAVDVAAEEKGANFSAGANFTAWHENAATSAIGRALDAAGYSKNKEAGTRASREEMEKAERHAAARSQPQPTANQRPTLQVVQTPRSYEATWVGYKCKAEDFGFVSDVSDDYARLYVLLVGTNAKSWTATEYGLAIGESDTKWRAACAQMNAEPALMEVAPTPPADKTLEAMSK